MTTLTHAQTDNRATTTAGNGRSNSTKTQRLFDVPVGASASIDDVTSPGMFSQRLRELGIRKGMIVTVAQKASGGGRVIRVNNARYAIDSYTLKRILVSPVSQ